jgi:hypothetical protein
MFWRKYEADSYSFSCTRRLYFLSYKFSSKLHKGASKNYVDKIFPIIDHLTTLVDICEGILLIK